MSSFLQEVALVADIDGVESDNNKVLLMTLHSAKGLEFPVVYLAGMETGFSQLYEHYGRGSSSPSRRSAVWRMWALPVQKRI